MGDSGDSVVILQQKLKKIGLYNAVINGEFGLATEVGVKTFQKEAGLEETGVVDVVTWNRLNDYSLESARTINAYSSIDLVRNSNDIADVQRKLKVLLYYTGPITGVNDLETQNAIKRFQLNNDLTANGIVNEQTMNLINNLYGNLSSCAINDDYDSGDDNIENEMLYTVVRGDTLYSIARKFNTTVNDIIKLNNLNSTTLTIGQTLKIPGEYIDDNKSDVSYIQYVVSGGDTLHAIARRYNTNIDEIKRLNNLSSNVLSIGQVLNIPSSNSTTDYLEYVVVRGDTLYSIARNYGISVNQIRSLNNLVSDTLSIGQVLKIPNSSTQSYTNYVVVNGDTLYSIARKYNTSVDEIKRLNNISSNVLSIGQVLKMPL